MIDVKEKRLTLCPAGELDHHTAKAIREEADAAIRRTRPVVIVIDFSAVSFMDSSGIGLIMGRYRLARSLGSNLRVQGATPRLETIIRLAGMDKLPIWDERERMNENETCQ